MLIKTLRIRQESEINCSTNKIKRQNNTILSNQERATRSKKFFSLSKYRLKGNIRDFDIFSTIRNRKLRLYVS